MLNREAGGFGRRTKTGSYTRQPHDWRNAQTRKPVRSKDYADMHTSYTTGGGVNYGV